MSTPTRSILILLHLLSPSGKLYEQHFSTRCPTQSTRKLKLTAAARSIWPGAAGFGPPPAVEAGLAAGVGRAAVGTGGLPGLEATGGGGFGFAPTGGGALAPIVREPDGEPPFEAPVEGVLFFQGAAVPFAAAIPGNTETGFALEFAAIGLAAGVGTALGAEGRGGGGGPGTCLGFAGTSSR